MNLGMLGSPWEGGPSGISIGRALAIPPGIVHDELRECVALLDRIHGVGELPSIPFSLGRLPDTGITGLIRRGRFAYSLGGDPESIIIDLRLPDRGLTALHEIGHFLDLCELGPPRRWESLIEDGVLAEWRSVVLGSDGVDRLDELSHATEPLIARTARNALDWPELWSRSYAQYVASRSNGPRLISQLDHYRGPQIGGIYLPLQWEIDDFVAIDHAIEEIFRRLGWRTE